MPLSFCFDYGDKDNNKNQEKQNYQHFFVNRSLFSRTNGRWPKGKAICNSAAMSWGFAIPTSTVLFVNLSNRITNSFCGESKTCPLFFLFLSMVEAHNELFAANASEEDEVDEEA